MFKLDDVYQWLVQIYAYEYPGDPISQLNRDIARLQGEGKSRERAVLELALQSGLRLLEIEKLEDEGRTREEAILEFLKGQKLQLREDDRKIQEMIRKAKSSIGEVTKERPVAERRNWRTLAKYFTHGLVFSVIMIFLVFLWAFVLVFLVVAGAFIGLIIGFVVLFLILGGLNSFLSESIWSISTRTGWMSLLGHGIVLFIALIIVHIPSIIVNLMEPSLPITIVLSIAEAFLDGFVAKHVASFWEEY